MSDADPSDRELGLRHGSSAEVGTTTQVPHRVAEALANLMPSSGRRGDEACLSHDPALSDGQIDSIGSPGLGDERLSGINSVLIIARCFCGFMESGAQGLFKSFRH